MQKNKEKIVVLVHGRHLETKGWEELVWGKGERIGSAPLGLSLAQTYNGALIFGTGASVKDGLKECEFTVKYLRKHLSSLSQFSEFAMFDHDKERNTLESLLDNAVLDRDSQNTDQEVRNAIDHAKLIGATVLVQVTSPAHAARCTNTLAKLIDSGFDFGEVTPMVVPSRSSSDEYRATDTVVFEHPHRGDDPSPTFTDILPGIFKIPQTNKKKFKAELAELITKYSR